MSCLPWYSCPEQPRNDGAVPNSKFITKASGLSQFHGRSATAMLLTVSERLIVTGTQRARGISGLKIHLRVHWRGVRLEIKRRDTDWYEKQRHLTWTREPISGLLCHSNCRVPVYKFIPSDQQDRGETLTIRRDDSIVADCS